MRVFLALAFLVGCASAASTYLVSQQSGQAMSPLTDLPLSSVNGHMIGPFNSLSNVQSASDPSAYAATWQIPIALPFSFPFFGVEYNSITLTSKGYIYFGSYSAAADAGTTFATAASAPDYSAGGAGFPLHRPLLSFFHNAEGAVPMTDLEQVSGKWYITNFMTQGAAPVNSTTTTVTSHQGSTTTTLSTEVSLPPPNSISGVEDGERFIINTDNTDAEGVLIQLAVVLHESGLIETHYYTIQPSDSNPDLSSVPDGEVSIGVQSPSGFFVSANRFSQRTFADLNEELLESVVSFTPIQQVVEAPQL
jgi:hypothetical protein